MIETLLVNLYSIHFLDTQANTTPQGMLISVCLSFELERRPSETLMKVFLALDKKTCITCILIQIFYICVTLYSENSIKIIKLKNVKKKTKKSFILVH